MHILLTRPYEQALETRRQLIDIGCRVSLTPVLDIVPVQYSQEVYKNSKGFVVTSVHASQQIAKQQDLDRETTIYAVGTATAKPLFKAGFSAVQVANGDAKSLLALIKKERHRDEGLLTYLSGWHITQDLARVLAMDGYDAQRVVCYKAIPKKKLDVDIMRLIKEEEVEAAVFYSCRSALFFNHLMKDYKLSKHLKRMTAITISDTVASALRHSDWESIVSASEPSQDAIISELLALKSKEGRAIITSAAS